ncbi:hypothetical protein G6F32_013818 [Rhizopus arrhizus]|nr:hypothetical protein G6F32_013818 [Rhizopus arrhizus]
MVDKGLVKEGSQHGLNVYSAQVGKVATLAALSADFARRVLEIDGPLPTQALKSGHSSVLAGADTANARYTAAIMPMVACQKNF